MNADIILFSAGAEMSWVRFTAALDTLLHTQSPTANLVGLGRLDAIQSIAKLWMYHSATADLQTTDTESISTNVEPYIEQPQDMLILVDKFLA
jgi:hypothetical protein